MQIDPHQEHEDRTKTYKRYRGKTEEDDNLPVLQSYRNNQVAQHDLKKVFNSNYQQLMEQK